MTVNEQPAYSICLFLQSDQRKTAARVTDTLYEIEDSDRSAWMKHCRKNTKALRMCAYSMFANLNFRLDRNMSRSRVYHALGITP